MSRIRGSLVNRGSSRNMRTGITGYQRHRGRQSRPTLSHLPSRIRQSCSDFLDEREATEPDARGHPAVAADGSRIMESFIVQCQSVVERQTVSLRRAFSPCL
jgi:hypothetical protein